MGRYLRRFLSLACLILVAAGLFPLRPSAASPVLRVAFEPNFPPYQFEKDGEYVGLHIDVLNKLAEKHRYQIEYLPMDTMSDCKRALENGQADLILGAVLNYSPEYVGRATAPISMSSVNLISERGRSSERRTLVYEEGTVSPSFLYSLKNKRSIPVSNQVQALDYLLSGRADSLIGVEGSICYQLEQMGLGERYVVDSNYMLPIEYAIVTRSGEWELLQDLNSQLNQLRVSGEYEQIYERWVDEQGYIKRQFVERTLWIVGGVVAVSLLAFFFNLRHSLLLKRQVNEKTRALQESNAELEEQITLTRNSNELRARIVECSPSAILVFDRDCEVTVFNRSAALLPGCAGLDAGANVYGFPILEQLLPKEGTGLFTEKNTRQNRELIFTDAEGQEIHYRYNLYMLYNKENRIRGAILSIDDVTQEIQIKEQFFEKQKNLALNRMVAGIAHEIRNPLMSIKTYAQLIPLKRENLDFQNQMAEYIPREVDRVCTLINDLIDYAKPRAGTREKVLVAPVVESGVALIEPSLRRKPIRIQTEIQEGLTIYTDPGLLKQVLLNILLNSIEAIEQKLEQNPEPASPLGIEIRGWADERHRYLQVLDEGIGMTGEELSKAAEPFYTTKKTGTGLGLALCKQYMEDGGGRLFLMSKQGEHTRIILQFGR